MALMVAALSFLVKMVIRGEFYWPVFYTMTPLVLIPDLYDSIYTQISGEKAKFLQSQRARANASAVGETRIYNHGITPDEVLEMTNKIFAPYTVEFASPLSWFAMWKGERSLPQSLSYWIFHS